MAMELCKACGTLISDGGYSLGGVLLCRECEPQITSEVEVSRANGKPVNVAHIAHRIYKANNDGGNYLLRDIPSELWDKAKHRAVNDGDSIRDLVLKALYTYLK